MDLQAFFDGLSVQWKEERARTQMTLGSLIARLFTNQRSNYHG